MWDDGNKHSEPCLDRFELVSKVRSVTRRFCFHPMNAEGREGALQPVPWPQFEGRARRQPCSALCPLPFPDPVTARTLSSATDDRPNETFQESALGMLIAALGAGFGFYYAQTQYNRQTLHVRYGRSCPTFGHMRASPIAERKRKSGIRVSPAARTAPALRVTDEWLCGSAHTVNAM